MSGYVSSALAPGQSTLKQSRMQATPALAAADVLTEVQSLVSSILGGTVEPDQPFMEVCIVYPGNDAVAVCSLSVVQLGLSDTTHHAKSHRRGFAAR